MLGVLDLRDVVAVTENPLAVENGGDRVLVELVALDRE